MQGIARGGGVGNGLQRGSCCEEGELENCYHNRRRCRRPNHHGRTPTQALCEADVAGVVTVLSNSGVASAWLMAHSLELIAAYVAAGGAAAGGGGSAAGGAIVPAGGGAAAAGGGGGGGLLSRRLVVSGCDLMEYFRLAWAESLLPVGVLGGGWALALGYLAWCPTHGAAAAEALMEALPVRGRGGSSGQSDGQG